MGGEGAEQQDRLALEEGADEDGDVAEILDQPLEHVKHGGAM